MRANWLGAWAAIQSAAGLLHDLGHGPFSHVFEHQFMPLVASSTGVSYHHEDMSLKMIDYMVDENQIDLDRSDVRFIQEVIVGAKEWVWVGLSVEPVRQSLT